jgi:hypothetical protein
LAKAPLGRVLLNPQSEIEPIRAKQGYEGELAAKGPSLPHKPQIEIEDAGGVRQGGNDLAFHRHPVCVDFLEKGLAKNNGVF